MEKRLDVQHTARRLADISKIHYLQVLSWVASVCKFEMKKPKYIPFAARENLCYVVGNIDNFRLEAFTDREPVYCGNNEQADYWWDMIMEKQEAYQD